MKNTVVKMNNWQRPEAAYGEETIANASIAWRKISDEKGRGVFALRNFKKGEVIEICPVVPVSKKSFKHNGEAPDGYVFDWDLDVKGEEHAMPLGYAMLYNHSATPNMAMENDMDEYTITVTASRAIKAGEELTWNYACELWFDEA